MIFYYIYILISLFCIIREESGLSEKKRLWNLRIAILPVFVLMAFKAPTVGSDTPNYIRMYEMIADTTWYLDEYGGIEPGYNLFQRALHLISADPQTLMIGVAVVVAIALFYFFKEYKYACFALYFFTSLGFLSFALSGLRQTLAIAIGMLAYRYIKGRKIVPFFLVTLLAFTFHRSALFIIPAYFIANQQLKAKNVSMVFFLILLVFFFADKLLLTVADIMSYDKYGVEYTANGYQFFLLVLLVTIVVIKNRDKIIKFNASNLYVLNINFLSMAMWIIRLASRTAERVSFYFLPYTAAVMSEYIATCPKSTRIQLKIICLFVATYLFLHRVGYQEDIEDYMFFFIL